MILCFSLIFSLDKEGTLLTDCWETAYCTPCSLTNLDHCIKHWKFWYPSRNTSTLPHMSTPLHPPNGTPEAEVCDKVPGTSSFPVLLCPDRVCHTFLIMDMGIWHSSQGPKLFSAILVIFHVGSPILTMPASYHNPSTENSHVGGIICKYHNVALLSEMMLH
jgi:hypothetical protein